MSILKVLKFVKNANIKRLKNKALCGTRGDPLMITEMGYDMYLFMIVRYLKVIGAFAEGCLFVNSVGATHNRCLKVMGA